MAILSSLLLLIFPKASILHDFSLCIFLKGQKFSRRVTQNFNLGAVSDESVPGCGQDLCELHLTPHTSGIFFFFPYHLNKRKERRVPGAAMMTRKFFLPPKFKVSISPFLLLPFSSLFQFLTTHYEREKTISFPPLFLSLAFCCSGL